MTSSKKPFVCASCGKTSTIYRKGEAICLATASLVDRFLAASGSCPAARFTEIARSMKQYVAEVCASCQVDREAKIDSGNFACAAIGELVAGYRHFMAAHGIHEWPDDDPRRQRLRDKAAACPDWADWREVFEKRPLEEAANTMLELCRHARGALDTAIAAELEAFRREGLSQNGALCRLTA